MKLTKLQIIDETVEYYSADVRRRSVNSSGNCMYKSPTGKMCAVGRCLLSKDLERVATSENGSGVYYIFMTFGVDILKAKYRGHDDSFWSNLQGIHDTGAYWNRKGLSRKGKQRVAELRKKYSTE